jgi:CDP-diacylglycerol--serine O-phosphatidyltransferase
MNWRHGTLTCFTLSILFAAVMSILKAMGGDYVHAARLIVLAGVLDGLDGSLARRLGSASAFGARLDTYVDTVSFGVAPAVLAYGALCGGPSTWGALIAMAIVTMAVLRFTRGCDWPEASGRHEFRGLPIPVSGLWLAAFALLVRNGALEGVPASTARALTAAMWVGAAAMLVLQLSNVRYAKPRKELVAAGMALSLVILLAFGYESAVLVGILTISLLLYAVGGPFMNTIRALTEDDNGQAANGE